MNRQNLGEKLSADSFRVVFDSFWVFLFKLQTLNPAFSGKLLRLIKEPLILWHHFYLKRMTDDSLFLIDVDKILRTKAPKQYKVHP